MLCIGHLFTALMGNPIIEYFEYDYLQLLLSQFISGS